MRRVLARLGARLRRSPAVQQAVARLKLRAAWHALTRAPAPTRLRRLRRDVGALLRIDPVFVASDRGSFLDAWRRWSEASARAARAPGGQGGQAFHLRRFCLCCNETTSMRVDDIGSAAGDASGAPNWRERLVCRHCGMNNRQRLVAKLVQQFARDRADAAIYLMERVTPIFEWVARLPGVRVQGSEYLGPQYQGGVDVRGVRHEDVMQLSYPDGSFDLVVSNDVLEHVPDPERALRECFRVLQPGGQLLATFPFHVTHDETIARARFVGNEVQHLLPPEYHGNPLSADGSLVFHDFGWTLLDVIRRLGFSPAIEAYASDAFGHLGDPLLVFRLTKPARTALA